MPEPLSPEASLTQPEREALRNAWGLHFGLTCYPDEVAAFVRAALAAVPSLGSRQRRFHEAGEREVVQHYRNIVEDVFREGYLAGEERRGMVASWQRSSIPARIARFDPDWQRLPWAATPPERSLDRDPGRSMPTGGGE